jgi:transcriptional regulator with XRE-family HTH domain
MRLSREKKGLTIIQLSNASGIAVNTISSLERNNRYGGWLVTVEILADTLGLSIDEYVGHKVVGRK